MEFTSFLNLIIQSVQQKFGEGYEIFSQSVTKNNGIERTGIVAKKENINSFPTIYMNEYYKENITEEECEQIAEMVYQRMKDAEMSESVDMSAFTDFRKARKHVAYKLINTERNKELLKEIPHREFFNLSMVYFYLLPDEAFDGKATILIKDSHMKVWKITEEELYETAYENTPELLPSRIDSMEELMKDLYQDDLLQETVPMFVLTNSQKLFGAACMLYPGELKSFARLLESNLYVLPSSVHEIILVPERKDVKKEVLLRVVMEINRSDVTEEEFLADSVYFYNKKEESLYLLDNF